MAAPLSPRQRQVVELVAEGYTNQQIAGRLAISARRVSSLVALIGRKWQVSPDRDERVQIAVYWIRTRITDTHVPVTIVPGS